MVLLRKAANYNGRMRPQGIHHYASSKFREIVQIDSDNIVLWNHVVDLRLELDQVFDPW